MKQILRRGTLSALLALAVLPVAAQAAFTPTVSLQTLTAGCGPKGVNALPSTGGGLPAGTYKFKVEATVGGTDTTPCQEITTGSTVANAAFLVQWETTPGATQYKVFRNDTLIRTIAAGTPLSATGACPPTTATPNTSPVARCFVVDNAGNTPGAAPNALPSTVTKAGASPDLVVAQTFDFSGDADSTNDPAPDGTASSTSLKTNVLHFPSGLAANPTATTVKCKLSGAAPSLLGSLTLHGTADPDEDTCPRASQVGTILANIRTPTAPATPTVGDIYLGERLGSETARLYVALRPACSSGSFVAPNSSTCTGAGVPTGAEVEKSFLSAKATIKQDGDTQVVTIDNETTSISNGTDEPLSSTSFVDSTATGSRGAQVPIQAQRITQYLFGSADQGTAAAGDDKSFVLLPTSCAAETFGIDAASYKDPTNVNATAALQATGCDTVAFSPSISAKLDVSGGQQGENGHPAFEATISQGVGEAAQRTAQVTLPNGLGTNIVAVGNACTQAQLVSTDGCPATSKVGTVTATSPLLGNLAGPVFLVQSATSGSLPDLIVNLNGDGASVRLRGGISFNADNTRLVNTFDKIPDTPLSSFKLSIDGGPNGLLQNARDLCTTPLGNIDATFTGQNDKQTTQSVAVDQSSLANCVYYYITPPGTPKAKKPKWTLTLRGVKKGRSTIATSIKRGGTNKRDNLRRTKLTLPKGLSFRKGSAAKKRVTVKVNGKKTTKFTIKGRTFRSNQSKTTVRTIRITTKKGAIKTSKPLQRSGRKKKRTFKLAQRVQGGRTFTITKKVKPRS